MTKTLKTVLKWLAKTAPFTGRGIDAEARNCNEWYRQALHEVAECMEADDPMAALDDILSHTGVKRK